MLPDNEQTSRMDNIYIAPTPSSPEVDFRFDTHTLSLRGESYPENAAAFYGQIIERLKAYLDLLQDSKVEVNIALAYFNSSSTKMLFNLIAALDEAAEAGNHIALNWFHDEEDDTIFEFGQELCEDFPAIHFVNHPVRPA
ncbi:putative lipoprotein [Acidovorax delafieldii 2AN]|uniref:Putative lipoprotein n=2 Tax=Acidovorax delafieldii TaxID=47920 RepID=C5T5I1_ACIDE|nr:putative lipoprotein [Acidovorax delafieldii 2AN]